MIDVKWRRAPGAYHAVVDKARYPLPSGWGTHAQVWCRLSFVLFLLAVAGCSSMLPRGTVVTSSFRQFDALRAAVNELKPMHSDERALVRLGLDPASLPNTTILTYTDLLRRFSPGTVAIKEDLDPGIVACLAARDACRGWELSVASIERQRSGGFWADFLNFRRRTTTSGWRFNALILMADGLVVYRSWGGQPLVNEVDDRRNPLGPLQDLGPAVIFNAP